MKDGVVWVCQAADAITGIQCCLARHINGIGADGWCAWGPIGMGAGEDPSDIGGVADGAPYAPMGKQEPENPKCACPNCKPDKDEDEDE